MSAKQRKTDDRPLTRRWELFAEDAASGMFTQVQLGEKHKMSAAHAGRVIRGRHRPAVARRIRQILEHIRQTSLRLIGSRLHQAVATLVAQLNHKDARIAQSAAKKIIELGLSPEAAFEGGQQDGWEIPAGMWSEPEAS